MRWELWASKRELAKQGRWVSKVGKRVWRRARAADGGEEGARLRECREVIGCEQIEGARVFGVQRERLLRRGISV